MKTLGMVGGIAPESTVEYYRRILESCRARGGGGHNPRILIHSIDLVAMLDLVASGAKAQLAASLLGEIRQLAASGADLALFASNTPHMVFDEVAREAPIPMLSIVQAAGRAARAGGYRKVGLLGTRFTMGAAFYPEVLAREGIEVVSPGPEDQERVHGLYMGELVEARFRDETRRQILEVVERMRDRHGIQAVILGGTELSLLIRQPGHAGVAILDTTALHVEEAVTALLAP